MARLYKTRFRKMRKMRGFTYRGFRVELYNNHWWSFKYEWKVVPLGPTSLRLTKRRGKMHKVIHDPTSHVELASAGEYAIMKINELNHPFWYRR